MSEKKRLRKKLLNKLTKLSDQIGVDCQRKLEMFDRIINELKQPCTEQTK